MSSDIDKQEAQIAKQNLVLDMALEEKIDASYHQL